MRLAVDWGLAARFYDLQLALERPSLRATLDLLNPARGDELLDLGTGTGAFLRELAKRGERPQRLIAVDRSRAMLDRIPPLPAGWTLVEADATALPFAEASFDVVVIAYVLHFLDERTRERLVEEARRVLRVGGRLATVTPDRPRRAIVSRLYASLMAVATWSGWPVLEPLDPQALLEAAGFEVVARRRVRRGYPSLCVVAVVPESARNDART